jgi:hypothetical protein
MRRAVKDKKRTEEKGYKKKGMSERSKYNK